MTLEVIHQLGSGIQIGSEMTYLKRLEDSVRAGRSAVFTAFSQLSQVNDAVTISNAAFAACNMPSIPFLGRVAIVLTAPILAFAGQAEIENDFIRKMVIFAQDHLGDLCQLAAAVAAVALVAMEQYAMGVSALLFLAIGFFDRLGILPEGIRHLFHAWGLPIMEVSGLIYGGWLPKLTALAVVVAYVAETIFSHQDAEEHKKQIAAIRKGHVDLEALIGALSTARRRHVIEPAYALLPTDPPAPDIDVMGLLRGYEEIDWSAQRRDGTPYNHVRTLRMKLAFDDRFRQLEGCAGSKTDEEVIAWFLETFPQIAKSERQEFWEKIPWSDPDNVAALRSVLGEGLIGTQNDSEVVVLGRQMFLDGDVANRSHLLSKISWEKPENLSFLRGFLAQDRYESLAYGKWALEKLEDELSTLFNSGIEWTNPRNLEALLDRVAVASEEGWELPTGIMTMRGPEFMQTLTQFCSQQQNAHQCYRYFLQTLPWKDPSNLLAIQSLLPAGDNKKEPKGNFGKKSDKEVISIVQHSLQSLLESIRDRTILAGEPKDYEQLLSQLKVIAAVISEEQDLVKKVDVLFRLAVEGGEYCGPGKYEAIESIYSELVLELPGISFERKVLNVLENFRRDQILETYSRLTFEQALVAVTPLEDVHTFNQVRGLLPEEIRARRSGAGNDELTNQPALLKLILRWSGFKKTVNEALFHINSHASDLVEEVQTSLGTHRLPLGEYVGWWNAWLQRNEEAAQTELAQLENADTSYRRQQLQTQLQKIQEQKDQLATDCKLFGRSLVTAVNVSTRPGRVITSIDRFFLSMMLEDMGILRDDVRELASSWH